MESRKRKLSDEGYGGSEELGGSENNKRTLVVYEEFDANNSFSSQVAAHYNSIQETGVEHRERSKIYYLRNFNNWIKSALIKEYINKIQSNKHNCKVNVLDMCCGKGGDLLKWKIGKITHLICADIAGTSIEQCQVRYEEMKQKARYQEQLFTTQFITADCTRTNLRTHFKDPSISLDIVSCQFSFHYCFESLPQAECMLKNASDCLKIGGYFIGTMPDATDIVYRMSQSGNKTFGNKLYNITMQCDEPFPIFGAKYDFQLEGVVNCPEFLVHFPVLVELAKRYGFELILRERFDDYYEKCKDEYFLLEKMKALETYPAEDNELNGCDEDGDYDHVKDLNKKCGTMSKSEWEAVSLYLVFAFKKVKKITNI